MAYFPLSFKKSLGLVCLAVIASLICSLPTYAMDADREEAEKAAIAISRDIQSSTLDNVNMLIVYAIQGHRQAQDKLMEIYYTKVAWELIGPEAIKFLSWENIQERCNKDDKYAYFLIANSYCYDRTYVEKFHNFFNSIKSRADLGNASAQYNLGLMYEFGFDVEEDKKEAIRLYTLAANQGDEKARLNLSIKYEMGLGIERNLIEALRWHLTSRSGDVHTQTFFKKALPDTPVTGDDFQKILDDIIHGTPSAEGKEDFGLSLVLQRHQLKMLMNKNGGFKDQVLAIPDLGEMYKSIVEVEEEVMKMMGDLQKAKPGFMTSFSLSDECKEFLPQQHKPLFFSEDSLQGGPAAHYALTHYITWGEENVSLVKKFVTFHKEINRKMEDVDIKLLTIATLYKNGQARALSDLMVAQCRVQNSNDPKLVAELVTEFEKCKNTYEDIKSCVAIPLQEIEEDRALLDVTLGKIQSLPKLGLGSRNTEALKEYPALEELF
ncbi:MAG: sel1 repeat family protein [Alphaproteobacteria bacterium]|nr:sel1 repeat family protein [Alphaproteobacteria bacterium]